MKQKSLKKVLGLVSVMASKVASVSTVASVPWYHYQPKAPKSLIRKD